MSIIEIPSIAPALLPPCPLRGPLCCTGLRQGA